MSTDSTSGPARIEQSSTVGFVGLGRMGLTLAKTLRRTGFDVIATSRSSGSRGAAAVDGIRVVDQPVEVARGAEIILVSVFDTAALEAVVRGANGLLTDLRPGTMVVDLGTSGLSVTHALAKGIEARGGFYIDAPVSGGTRGAAEGRLTIMAGGTEEAIERARPVLEALGRLNHMGPIGAGQSTKAVNQTILGQTLVAVAEGMTLAKRLGLDPARVREALMGGFADSRVLAEHGRRMVEEDFTPGGSIAVFSKDLKLVRMLLYEIDLELPGMANADDQYAQAMHDGLSDLDQSAIVTLYEGEPTQESAGRSAARS